MDWLRRCQDVTGVGGCASTYNLVLGWGGPYPETTGYIIPTFFDYAEQKEVAEPRDRAITMADWLLKLQLDEGGFPGGVNQDDAATPNVFNTGQIVLGLTRTYRETGEQRYLDAVQRACGWLVEVQHKGGYWDVFDYKDTVHTYSSRISWALLEAHRITGVEEYRDAAMANLYWVADHQRPNGWFEKCGFGRGEDPFLHTLAYTIRGLLEGALLVDDDELVATARRSADALCNLQQGVGILKGQCDENFESPSFYCLTGNAQMAIVWYRLYELTSNEDYRTAANDSIEFLKTKHRIEGRPEVRGGIKGSHPVWQRYMYLRYPNWSTKFFADGLMLSNRLS